MKMNEAAVALGRGHWTIDSSRDEQSSLTAASALFNICHPWPFSRYVQVSNRWCLICLYYTKNSDIFRIMTLVLYWCRTQQPLHLLRTVIRELSGPPLHLPTVIHSIQTPTWIHTPLYKNIYQSWLSMKSLQFWVVVVYNYNSVFSSFITTEVKILKKKL